MALALKQLNVDCEPGAIAHIYEGSDPDPVAVIWRGFSGEKYFDGSIAWFTAADLRHIADLIDTIN